MNWLAPADWGNAELEAQADKLWKLPELACLCSLLVEREGYSLYLVGGAVRDLLVGRAVKDFDLLVTCSPQELLDLRSEISSLAGVTVFPLDAERGYFRVCYRDSEGVDLAALGRATLWEDLRRRDLTFNAMALDSKGHLADPFDGREDLREKRVRVVDPDVLVADPLRILRCLRIAATLEFSVEPRTLECMRCLSPLLEQTAGERILEEFRRFCAEAKAAHWEALKSSGVCEAAWALLAEQIPWSWMRQWWSLGRSATFPTLLSVLLRQATEREDKLMRIKASRELVATCQRWWLGCQILEHSHPRTRREVYELVSQVGDTLSGLLDFTDLPAFSRPINQELKKRLLLAATEEGELRRTPLPLNGHDLCRHWNRKPGPWLGPVLAELQAAWACREVDSAEKLLAYSAAILR